MRRIYVALVLLLLAAVSPVSAETVSGTLGLEGTNYTTFSGDDNAYAEVLQPLAVAGYANDIELSGNMKSVVVFSTVASTYAMKLDTGAPSGASTTAKFIQCTGQGTNTSTGLPSQCDGGRVLGTGMVGYQRIYNTASPPVEQAGGYIYLIINSWNTAGLTGDIPFYIEYDRPSLYNLSTYKAGSFGPGSQNLNSVVPSGRVGIGYTLGNTFHAPFPKSFYTNYRLTSVTAAYSAADESGLGILGSITKTEGASQGVIFSGTTGAILASETTSTTNTFNFTIADQPIIISIRDATGTKYNSSVLFGPATPTPTPTGATTPVTPQNPIPAGYVRSMAECVDGTTNGRMGGCAVSLKDVEAGTWANSSTVGWDYGYYWIDTLPNHTIDAYGVLSGYSSVSRTGEPASGTRMIELVMWASTLPGPSTAGMVNLRILTNDIESGYALPQALIQVRDSATGITYSETSPTSGTAIFEVTNATMQYITVSKYGYVTKTVTFETSDFGPDTKRVELERATVTTGPTSTIPVGGVTTAVTVDPAGTPDPAGGASGYSNAKGQQMMDYLATHGMDLVELCFLVTILGLMGIRLGK